MLQILRLIKCYDKAIRIDPNYADAWINKGVALHELGKYEEAIVYYDKAIKLNSNDADAWYNRACANFKHDNTEEGLANLKRAIELDKNNIESAKREKDFDTIRNDVRFKALILNANT